MESTVESIWERRVEYWAICSSTCSLARSHRSLICLLCTARFVRALRCAHSLAYSLPSPWESGFCLWIKCVHFILKFQPTVQCLILMLEYFLLLAFRSDARFNHDRHLGSRHRRRPSFSHHQLRSAQVKTSIQLVQSFHCRSFPNVAHFPSFPDSLSWLLCTLYIICIKIIVTMTEVTAKTIKKMNINSHNKVKW